MRAVNLLPREPSQSSVGLPSAPVLVGVCAGVLVSALLGADFMMQSGKISKERGQLDSLQARVAALPPSPAGPTPAQTQLAGEHSQRVVVLSTAMSTRVAWDRVLREFSLVLPDDVWLSSLTAQSPVSPSAIDPAAPAATGTPTQFAISGHTYSHDGVARLLSRLQVIPDLENVTLVSASTSKLGGQTIVDFQIAANIRTAGGTPSS
jgi:Tfp pilus assembly protein PilN